jgi:hypothetical protein
MKRIDAFNLEIRKYKFNADFPCVNDIFDVDELYKIKEDVNTLNKLLPIPEDIYNIPIRLVTNGSGSDAVNISYNGNSIFLNVNPVYFPLLNQMIENFEIPENFKFKKEELYDRQFAVFTHGIEEFLMKALKKYEIKLNEKIKFLTEDIEITDVKDDNFYLKLIKDYVKEKGNILLLTDLDGIDNVLCDYPNGMIDCVEGIMSDRIILATYFGGTNDVITTNDKFYKQMNIEELKIVADIVEQVKKKFDE